MWYTDVFEKRDENNESTSNLSSTEKVEEEECVKNETSSASSHDHFIRTPKKGFLSKVHIALSRIFISKLCNESITNSKCLIKGIGL